MHPSLPCCFEWLTYLHALPAKQKCYLRQRSGFQRPTRLPSAQASITRKTKLIPETNLPAPTVVFDLDGTLIDTAPDLVASLNHTISAHGLAPVTYEDLTHLVGHGARAMIERAFRLRGHPLEESELPAMMDRFVAHYLAGMPG
ncbi:MAG: hypothetical protein EOP18_05320, partial [Rhizobiaceae bacterium]